jgi:hypothetical protein
MPKYQMYYCIYEYYLQRIFIVQSDRWQNYALTAKLNSTYVTIFF